MFSIISRFYSNTKYQHQ